MSEAIGLLESVVSYDLAPIAQDLARWLRTRPGVSDVQPPVLAPRPATLRPRLPMPIALPLPGFLSNKRQPSFEIRFAFKGERRVFRYYVEALDDPATVRDTLRVHTNGELMVRVPDEYGHIVANEIYYSNRSTSATVMGNPAPRA